VNGPTLPVDLGGLSLPTPVLVASGCFGLELGRLTDLRKLGGIVTRTITLDRIGGAPAPRVAETPSGLLSETGLQNEGVDAFLRTELPALSEIGIPVVVSLGGSAVEEFMHLTMAVDVAAHSIAAIEINTCTPSRDREGQWFAASPHGAAEVVGAVARLTRLLVFAKLSAGVADIARVAEACVEAGAGGLTLIHPLRAMSVDPDSFRPTLAAGGGGLSGPAIRPIAVRAVHDVAQALPEVPIMGVGGVTNWHDAMEMIMAGAWAVQMGTAVLSNPSAPLETAAGILRFLQEHDLATVADVRGRSSGTPPVPVAAAASETP